jgi:hypothetical protein
MIPTHTFGVEYLIRRCKECKKFAFIYARITVDGERAEVSTKEKIVANDWDPDKEILKGKAIEAKEVNHHLEEIRYKIRNTDSFLKTNP